MNITTRRINSFRIYFQITLYKAVLFPEIRVTVLALAAILG